MIAGWDVMIWWRCEWVSLIPVLILMTQNVNGVLQFCEPLARLDELLFSVC